VEALGNAAYGAVQTVDRCLRRAHRRLGESRWSLASFLKRNLPPAASYIRRFEEAGRREASRRRVDGVVCGHIHHPALQGRADGWYANAGDWVDNCTALVERLDGNLELVLCGAVLEAACAPQPFGAAAAAQGLGAQTGLTGT
jgi:UDP-2,3-diacylglucosamine pyrophosphatase LpxH